MAFLSFGICCRQYLRPNLTYCTHYSTLSKNKFTTSPHFQVPRVFTLLISAIGRTPPPLLHYHSITNFLHLIFTTSYDTISCTTPLFHQYTTPNWINPRTTTRSRTNQRPTPLTNYRGFIVLLTFGICCRSALRSNRLTDPHNYAKT